MALPLPKVVADTGPGGGLVTAMGGMNSLSNDMLLRQINAVKAQYAPLTAQADAASKLAYANLMGPQFLAKLMGNEDILASMTPEQQNQALKIVYRAGSGQGTGNALLGSQPISQAQVGGNPLAMPSPQKNPSLSSWIIDKMKNIFSGDQQQGAAPQQSINAFSQQPGLSEQDQQAISNMKPGDSYVVQGKGNNSGYSYDQNNNNVVATPAQIDAAVNKQSDTNQNSFAENAGTYAGIKEEGKEAGKIRAQDIKELNDIVFNADTKLATLNDLNDMIASPEMREIRQLPLAGSHELSWYAREGTPAQQQLVGRIRSQMGNVIKDSSRDFAGQFRKGEQQLLSGMKANDSDTIDTMIGKQESLTTMAKLLRERAALTSKYMTEGHINKLQAQDIADKQLDGAAIRNQIHDKLNPIVTIRNKKTGEKRTMSIGEARNLGAKPNV